MKVFLVGKGGSSATQTPGSMLLEIPAPLNVGVVVVNWHPKLNQIFAGCSDGR